MTATPPMPLMSRWKPALPPGVLAGLLGPLLGLAGSLFFGSAAGLGLLGELARGRDLVGLLFPLGREARGEEVDLQRAELAGVRLGPLAGGGQAPAAEEHAGLAAGLVPLVGGLAQPGLGAEPGPVGLDPLAELAPAADQRLVGHFHRGLAGVFRVALGRDQAGVGQAADDELGVGLGVGAGRDELAERRPPLGVLGPLAGLGQAEEDPATESRARRL